jgi:putative aldouronate transport system substrate-binding protein
MTMIREAPSRSGKMRAAGTIRDYKGKVEGYLVPEFGDTPVREIDAETIRAMAGRLDKIPSVLNRNSKHNGITRVMIVLMMILRQAARDGVIAAAPAVSIPAQKPVRHDEDHDPGEDVADPVQVEAVYLATPATWRVMILLAAWCQLRRGEALGLQRRDIVWHDDGTATLHVRRQLNANTGDYSDPKSEAGKRSMSVPKIMRDRLEEHLRTNVAPEAKAPLIPGSTRSSVPLSNTRRGFLAGSGGVLAAAALAACSPGSAGGAGGGTYSLLLPGDVPPQWDRVRGLVNAKMKADLGFEFSPEFINWTNYSSQALLKFTSGEDFQTALSARWLNIAQLIEAGALHPLDDALASGDYPNLTATVEKTAFDANRWPDGAVYGVPAVNSAARLHHHVVRGDLVDKYAAGSIETFDQLEKFWYDVLQKEGIPGYIRNNTPFDALGAPTGALYAEGWESPDLIPLYFSSDSLLFVPSRNASTTGVTDAVPFWEHEPYVEALRRTRQYYEDGIINADRLNADPADTKSRFDSGGAASTWGITDGLDTSAHLDQLEKAVPGATVMTLLPFRDGRSARPNQTFQADNLVVVNAAAADTAAALQLLEWVSVKENHDLLQYGEVGTDWEAVGDDAYEPIGDYANFPGFALSWRIPLERKYSRISESEDGWFEWSKDYENFTLDPFASFIPDLAAVETEHAQITAAVGEFGNPLFAGAVEVDEGLDKLKAAVDRAGLAKVQEELNKQADAYIAST